MLWLMWEPIISRVLFKLNGPGLWPNDPVRGHKYIRGRSTKVEVKMALQEKSPRNFYPGWFETFLSS